MTRKMLAAAFFAAALAFPAVLIPVDDSLMPDLRSTAAWSFFVQVMILSALCLIIGILTLNRRVG